MILILQTYLRPTKSRGKNHGFIHIITHAEPAEFLLCYRCATTYHCVVNMQIMEDHSTPARSVVFHIVSLNHFLKIWTAPRFFRICGLRMEHSRLLAVEEDKARS